MSEEMKKALEYRINLYERNADRWDDELDAAYTAGNKDMVLKCNRYRQRYIHLKQGMLITLETMGIEWECHEDENYKTVYKIL